MHNLKRSVSQKGCKVGVCSPVRACVGCITVSQRQARGPPGGHQWPGHMAESLPALILTAKFDLVLVKVF